MGSASKRAYYDQGQRGSGAVVDPPFIIDVSTDVGSGGNNVTITMSNPCDEGTNPGTGMTLCDGAHVCNVTNFVYSNPTTLTAQIFATGTGCATHNLVYDKTGQTWAAVGGGAIASQTIAWHS